MTSGGIISNHCAEAGYSTSSSIRDYGTTGAVKQSEFVSLDTNNWLLHARFVRGEHDICKRLAEEELLKSKGFNEYANFTMGLVLRVEGKIQESFEYFVKCTELNPRSAENTKQVGRSLFLLGKPQQAVERYLQTLKLTTTPDWKIFYNLGLCYALMGRFDEAEQNLTRAVDLGHTEDAYKALAQLYSGKPDNLRAITMYKAAFSFFPSNSEIATNLGLLYLEIGEFQKAFNTLGTALIIDPVNTRALLALGAEFQRNQEFDVALAKYKLCAESLRESAFLWNNIGMCFFCKKKYVAAISCLKRAAYLSPLDWKALFNLGLVHMHTRQYASAFHFLSASIRSNSLHGHTFLLLALALSNLANIPNARKAFDQAVKLSPKDATIRANYALFLKYQNEEDEAQRQVELFQRTITPGSDPQIENLIQSTFSKIPGPSSVQITEKSSESPAEMDEDEV